MNINIHAYVKIHYSLIQKLYRCLVIVPKNHVFGNIRGISIKKEKNARWDACPTFPVNFLHCWKTHWTPKSNLAVSSSDPLCLSWWFTREWTRRFPIPGRSLEGPTAVLWPVPGPRSSWRAAGLPWPVLPGRTERGICQKTPLEKNTSFAKTF